MSQWNSVAAKGQGLEHCPLGITPSLAGSICHTNMIQRCPLSIML
jgi:hypothetical protein